MSKINILCVEDGSVNLDSLEDEGLKDGKVLVYRQGSRPPFVLEISNGLVEDMKREQIADDTIKDLENENKVLRTALHLLYIDYAESLENSGCISMPSEEWYINQAKEKIKGE